MKLLNFHYYPCLIYIIFRVLTYSIRMLIRHFFREQYLKYISILFLMFLGESFAGFLYIYEKKISKNENNNNNEKEIVMKQHIKKKKIKLKIIHISFIAFCGFIDCFFSFDYSILLNSEMKNLNEQFLFSKKIFLVIILCLIENSFFNFEKNNHHYLGLIISLISLIIIIIYNLLKFKSYLLLFLIFLLYVEIGFFGSSLYLIEKKLNFKYYMNVYYICFIEGIFGCLFCFISSLISKKYFNIFFLNNLNKNEILIFITLIIIDCIFTCIYNICRLKISEKNRPSYNIIAEVFCVLFYNIFQYIFEKENWNYNLILFYFFSLLGSFIFCEIISLNFCNLNRNTFDITAKRAKMENNSINESDNSINSSTSENIFEENSF